MPERIAELKPRPRDRVTVTLSGGRFFTIPGELAESLAVGREIAADDIDRLGRVDEYVRGKDKALRLLSLRGRARREIDTALRSLGISTPVREGILGELEEAGLIDDARFAREFVRVKAEVRRMGPHRLRHDLRKLGVAAAVVDEVLEGEFSGERQEALAWELVDRKLGDGPVDERAIRRAADMLRRKGYDYEIVNRVSFELLRRAGRETPPE